MNSTCNSKNVRVYYRILPSTEISWKYLKVAKDRKTICIRNLQELAESKADYIKIPTYWRFYPDHVFLNDSQETIYNTVLSDLLDNVLHQGKDGIIMAYGQTGTGKSLTINGLHNHCFDDRGILPRIIPDLFNNLKTMAQKNIKICIQISYIEISRAAIKDLLKPYPSSLDTLKNALKMRVETEEDALKLAFIGEGRKEINQNAYLSNRSSSIFTFHIIKRNVDVMGAGLKVTRLHIVDLAGADTIGNLPCVFKNSYDIGAGNLAKTQLEQFLLILSTNIPNYIKVKQRLNPIIEYLGKSLRSSNILSFIGHIRTTREDLLITISMLRFGNLVQGIKPTKYQQYKECDADNKILYLQSQLDKMKKENLYKMMFSNSTNSEENLTVERYNQIERIVDDFLHDKIDDLGLASVVDVKIALDVIKKNYQKCENDKKDIIEIQRPSITKVKKQISGKSLADTSLSESKKLSKESFTSELSKKSASLDRGISTDSISKLKQSSRASIVRRSSQSIKLKSSRGSTISNLAKSKTDFVLLPPILPQFTEAWEKYLMDNNEIYVNFVKTYESNESSGGEAYKNYLKQINLLKDATDELEKHEYELWMAGMAKSYQGKIEYDENGQEVLGDIERQCQKNIETTRNTRAILQDEALKYQTQTQLYLNVCNNIKKELKDHFDDYCKKNYQMPIENFDDISLIEDKLFIGEAEIENENQIVDEEKLKKIRQYEEMHKLIMKEWRKRNEYITKNRKWTTTFHK